MRLHINIDHVATVRNARGTSYPDPVRAAEECLRAGADGITAHLREDRRHIRDEDVVRLREATRASTFNLEMAATLEMLEIARKVRPNVVTLVPERREERTTEGGLDVLGQGRDPDGALSTCVRALRELGAKVSLFIAADVAQVEASHALGAAQIELHTGDYAHAFENADARSVELSRLRTAAERASTLGLEVAAGHGLTRANVPPLLGVAQIEELNIGHAVIADALFLGLGGAVAAYRESVRLGRG
jgi:pyridoxine 5-phosphate synthase